MTLVQLQIIGVVPAVYESPLKWLQTGQCEFTRGNIVYRSVEPLRYIKLVDESGDLIPLIFKTVS